MEAASNIGLKSVKSEYVLIHDDDDSLQPEFLEKTVGFLDTNPRYKGVATGVMEIFEKIESNEAITIRSNHYKKSFKTITLAEISIVNQMPPISVLYKREVHNVVGYYNENLPVLGDWDFYLRFLKLYDIYKLNEVLANYHKRENTNDQYGNTVISGLDNHRIYDSLLRNEWLRQDLAEGKLGLGL